MSTEKNKFSVQKACAKRRNIQFKLSFEDWWDIWQQSGKWSERGCRKGQYVMSRYNDSGSYEVGNVFIQKVELNISEAQLGTKRSHGPMSEEHKRKLSIAKTGLKISGISKLKGRPQTEEHRMKNKLAQIERFAKKEIAR